jgi:hypothetical protein
MGKENTGERILDGVMDGEEVLPDDYPIHYDFLYVCDGRVTASDFGDGATVRTLKAHTGTKEVRRCDFGARNLF